MEGEDYHARLTEPTVARETLYDGPHCDDEKAFKMYGKSQNQVYHGSPERNVPPFQISVPVADYRQDCPGLADQSLQCGKQKDDQNIVYDQCYDRGDYSPDCGISDGH